MELIGGGGSPLKSRGLRSKQDTCYDTARRRRMSERKTMKQKKKKRKAGPF